MKIAVIGAGSIGRRHLNGLNRLRTELDITELRTFDANAARTAQAKEEVEEVVSAGSLADAVDGTDLVFLCVPTASHLPLYSELQDLGAFHLFIEKPLSHSLAGCDQMLFNQKRAGKIVAVGYMLRHHPVLKRVKSVLASGQLGRPLSARAEAGFFLPFWHPWEDYRDFYMSWKTGGGGALLDISHEIDYLQWLFGDIESVQGCMGTLSDLEISSDDMALAILRFENGMVGQFQLDLLQFSESRFCKVIGTEGVLIADLMSNEIKISTKDQIEWETESLNVEFDGIYADEYRSLIDSIRSGSEDYVSGSTALKTMEVIEAVRRSQALGARITLPLYD